MAYSPGKNEKSLCNKLLADWNGLLAPVYASKAAIQKASNDMLNKLREMVRFKLFTWPLQDLEDEINGFLDDVKDNLPGNELDDLQRLKYFLDHCDYLNQLEPISALIGTALGISDEIDSLIDNLYVDFPEFAAANFGSLIDNLLSALPGLPGGDVLADLLAQADELLNCLTLLCAVIEPDKYSPVLNGMFDELQTLYDDLNIIDDPNSADYGKFNYETIFGPPPEGAGLTDDQITAFEDTKTGLNAAKDSGVAAVDGVKSAIQQASRIGGMFS